MFFSGRIFESHPLTIYTATPDVSCITSSPAGISLGARAVGDWTRALNAYAVKQAAELGLLEVQLGAGEQTTGAQKKGEKLKAAHPYEDDEDKEAEENCLIEVPVQVMLDGPYGGCSIDLGEHETALLFAGGSGITFTLGVLDDIVGRVVRKGRKGGERTKRIEFAWCVRSFGMSSTFSFILCLVRNLGLADTHLQAQSTGFHPRSWTSRVSPPLRYPHPCHLTYIYPSTSLVYATPSPSLQSRTAPLPSCGQAYTASCVGLLCPAHGLNRIDAGAQTRPLPQPLKGMKKSVRMR